MIMDVWGVRSFACGTGRPRNGQGILPQTMRHARALGLVLAFSVPLARANAAPTRLPELGPGEFHLSDTIIPWPDGETRYLATAGGDLRKRCAFHIVMGKPQTSGTGNETVAAALLPPWASQRKPITPENGCRKTTRRVAIAAGLSAATKPAPSLRLLEGQRASLAQTAAAETARAQRSLARAVVATGHESPAGRPMQLGGGRGRRLRPRWCCSAAYASRPASPWAPAGRHPGPRSRGPGP
jgi:hypothetical protein